jgi:hypothetical protein
MGEIKSAWEIAMEKAEKLGKLPPEELRRQKEEKYASIGQALVHKYLGGLDLWQFGVELDKYSGEERTLLEEIAISKLAQSIDLESHERLIRIIDGISYLKQGIDIREIGEEIEQLFREYEQVEQKEREEMEKSARGILHRLRISGSAIGAVNPRAIGEWQRELDRIAQPYRERLEQLRQRLLDLPSGQTGAQESA